MHSEIHLTQFAKHGGCAAKIGPDTLSKVLGRLPKFSGPSLLVGFETSDDAAVYRISDDVAVIQTLDFFTPVVDDPYTFGQVAAANALSSADRVPKTRHKKRRDVLFWLTSSGVAAGVGALITALCTQ